MCLLEYTTNSPYRHCHLHVRQTFEKLFTCNRDDQIMFINVLWWYPTKVSNLFPFYVGWCLSSENIVTCYLIFVHKTTRELTPIKLTSEISMGTFLKRLVFPSTKSVLICSFVGFPFRTVKGQFVTDSFLQDQVVKRNSTVHRLIGTPPLSTEVESLELQWLLGPRTWSRSQDRD